MAVQSSYFELPTELKVQILSLLGPEKRQLFRRVCVSWNQLITQEFPVKLSVTNANWSHVVNCSTRRIYAKFCGLTYPMKVVAPPSFFRRLNSLTFTEHVVCYNLIQVLMECSNLHTLILKDVNVNKHLAHYTLNPGTDYLPNLRTFIFTIGIGRSNGNGDTRSLQAILPKLFPLLSSGTSKLEHIIVENYRWTWLGPRIKEIFAKNWQPAPVKIFLNFLIGIIRGNSRTLTQLGLSCTPTTRVDVRFCPRQLEPLAIVKFTQQYTFDPGVFSFDWIAHLKTQKDLISISITGPCEYFWADLSEIAYNNRMTLRYLDINRIKGPTIRQSNNPPIMFELPHGVDQLTKFIFLVEPICITPIGQYVPAPLGIADSPKVHFLSRFSSSLRVLSLSVPIQIPDDDFRATSFEHLINLEAFEYSADPWFYFGVQSISYLDETILRNLIDWIPKLRKFTLKSQVLATDKVQIPRIFCNIPSGAYDWIEGEKGIHFQKERVPGVFQEDREKFVLKISIEPNYRAMRNAM